MIAEEKWLEYLRVLDLVCIYCLLLLLLFFNVQKKIKVTFLWKYLGIL